MDIHNNKMIKLGVIAVLITSFSYFLKIV